MSIRVRVRCREAIQIEIKAVAAFELLDPFNGGEFFECHAGVPTFTRLTRGVLYAAAN